MRNLEADYRRIAEIKAAYEAAREAENENGMDAARADMKALNAVIGTESKEYGRILRFLEESREKENERLDIADNIWDREVEGLVQTMREAGIKEFTFSSTWTSATETAWLFTSLGCNLKGMVEINGSKDFMSETYEKKHAFLFTID
ncbi:MAG: hypothetical protein Q4B26_18315 [Eubacteriales bacterium]|nr:hypothetical protein [Eubacteriales bacterium]